MSGKKIIDGLKEALEHANPRASQFPSDKKGPHPAKGYHEEFARSFGAPLYRAFEAKFNQPD